MAPWKQNILSGFWKLFIKTKNKWIHVAKTNYHLSRSFYKKNKAANLVQHFCYI